MALTLEFLHHISNVQMLPRSHVVPLRHKRQGGLVMCRRSFTTVLDGTSPLPLLLLLCSLLLISPSPVESQVARASRFYGPVGVLHPVTACKREVIVSELKPHLSNMFPDLINFKVVFFFFMSAWFTGFL